MSHYFEHSSICQTPTADTTAPDFSDKVAMTFSRWRLKNVGNKRLVKWIPSVAAGLMPSYRRTNSLKKWDVPGEETNGTNGELYSPDN